MGMASARFAQLVDKVREGTGATLKEAVAVILLEKPKICSDVADDLGSYPSSEPVFAELQKQYSKGYPTSLGRVASDVEKWLSTPEQGMEMVWGHTKRTGKKIFPHSGATSEGLRALRAAVAAGSLVETKAGFAYPEQPEKIDPEEDRLWKKLLRPQSASFKFSQSDVVRMHEEYPYPYHQLLQAAQERGFPGNNSSSLRSVFAFHKLWDKKNSPR